MWNNALKNCADPKRAEKFLALLKSIAPEWLSAKTSPTTRHALSSLFSGSQALSEMLLRNPEWIQESLCSDTLKTPRHLEDLDGELQHALKPLIQKGAYSAAFKKVRRFNQRERIRIAVRDLAGWATATNTILEISDLAEVCLETVYRICNRRLEREAGKPYHLVPNGQWRNTEFCVLGMGKLGGQELNFSSDVDVLFAYTEDGFVFDRHPKSKRPRTDSRTTNKEFFSRLAEDFVKEVGQGGDDDDRLYRIDLNLRPDGSAGPLAQSISSYENYYAQYGQVWERMMLIKTRRVAGCKELAAEFIETIQPFRYPRLVGEWILDELSSMRNRITDERLQTEERETNLKLGFGGIREIEFSIQILQVLHGGKQPFIQHHQTLPASQKLADYRLMYQSDANDLVEAYCFLRRAEHRVQMEEDRQTHSLPKSKDAFTRISKLMGFRNSREFGKELERQRIRVRKVYEKVVGTTPNKKEKSLSVPSLKTKAEWTQQLAERGFQEVNQSFRMLSEFVNGPGFGHVSQRTVKLALNLIGKLMDLTSEKDHRHTAAIDRKLSDPDRVLTRLSGFLEAYGSRANLLETWNHNTSLFELLLFLFDRSEFLGELALQTPDLIDELEMSGQLRKRKNTETNLEELRFGTTDKNQLQWIRRYHESEQMRIGLRDILGLTDYEQSILELSNLADACVQYAMEIVLKKHRLKNPPFTVIALGKYGGQELNYGSDLDFFFVAKDSVKNWSRLQKIGNDILSLLSENTINGKVYDTDTRLRPDGEAGPLVNTLNAYREYYRLRAKLWEIQSVSRCRPVAGNPVVAKEFIYFVQQVTDFKNLRDQPAAYSQEWKSEIRHMRDRIEKERTPIGKAHWAIKTGAGGMIDAEFIAQACCLESGHYEPNTLNALNQALNSGILSSKNAEKLIENYQALKRIEGILRRWSFEGETTLPHQPNALYRVGVRCGFDSSDSFLKAVSTYRRNIRSIFDRYFIRDGR